MLKAAIYARKSTDDSNRNPENKSVQAEVVTAIFAVRRWSRPQGHRQNSER
jgi:hypothetical protein